MDDSDRQALLRIAADAVLSVVSGLSPPSAPNLPGGMSDAGAFVTLHVRGQLRGCVGSFFPRESLPQTVHHMAREACEDARFDDRRISPTELPEVEIEISVISPLRRTNDPESLRVGLDGIYIRRDGRTGCFLPQVAPEAGWDARTFLDKCCELKVGAAADLWRDPETEVFLFTTERFEATLGAIRAAAGHV